MWFTFLGIFFFQLFVCLYYLLFRSFRKPSLTTQLWGQCPSYGHTGHWCFVVMVLIVMPYNWPVVLAVSPIGL